MKRSWNVSVKYNDEHELVKIDLDATYATEHELGIDPMKKRFGVGSLQMDYTLNNKLNVFSLFSNPLRDELKRLHTLPLGINNRIITKCPDMSVNLDGVKRKLNGKYHKFYGISTHRDSSGEVQYKSYIERGDETKDAVGYWSESDFLIYSTNINLIEELASAFERNDIAFLMSGGDLMHTRSFSIAIASRLDKEYLDKLITLDKKILDMHTRVVDSDIHRKLYKADKGFCALSPSIISGELRFFLNPNDQVKYNYGWFNVSELEQWINETGVICK